MDRLTKTLVVAMFLLVSVLFVREMMVKPDAVRAAGPVMYKTVDFPDNPNAMNTTKYDKLLNDQGSDLWHLVFGPTPLNPYLVFEK